MKSVIVVLLLLAAAAGIGSALYQRGEYAKGTADRIAKSFALMHAESKLHTDQLEVEDEDLKSEIAERKGLKFDQRPLLLAKSSILVDEMALDGAKQDVADIVPEDSTLELEEGIGGALAGLAALILACIKPGNKALPSAA